MADRVVLHIGLMKSGSSYLQRRLARGKAALAGPDGQGVLFPLARSLDQHIAVAEVLEFDRRPVGHWEGAWARLVEETAAWPGAAVVSMELLAPASEEEIDRVVGSFAPSRVEVVITVRDLGSVIPSMWQEEVQNKYAFTLAEYAADIEATGGVNVGFHRMQDLRGIVERWSPRVDAVTVVTLPGPGSAQSLWERFCEAAAIPAGAAPEVPRANEALGAASANLMRRVNAALDASSEGGLDWDDYARAIKQELAKEILTTHRGEEQPVGFKPPRWLRQRGRQTVAWLRDSGVRVVGDPAELMPRRVSGQNPDRLRADAMSDAAFAAVLGYAQRRLAERPTTDEEQRAVEASFD